MLPFDGASVIKQAAFWVFGKAMTSRIDSAPVHDRWSACPDPNARPPLRRCYVFEGIQQETEFQPGVLVAEFQCAED
jgi:hypothetical protein